MHNIGASVTLTPKNRYIQVEEVNAPEANSKGFLLPDDYKAPPKEYDYYRVVDIANDCVIDLSAGDTIAVERHMVKSLKFDDQSYLLVLENYVLASLAS